MSKCPHCLDGLGSYNCFCTGQSRPDEEDRRARPSPTGEKVEAVASIWLLRNKYGDVVDQFPSMDAALEHEGGLWEGDTVTEWVPTATIAALVAERDEAQLRIAYLEEEIVRVRDLAVEHSTHSATANARVAELEKVLEPFKAFALNNVDEHGWKDGACKNDRICDWFGPSDFRAAFTAEEETKP